jgi:hypothetical protein
MSTNDQRDTTAPAVPEKTVTFPSEHPYVEPTKVDEATQQGTIAHFLTPYSPRPPPVFYVYVTPARVRTCDRNFEPLKSSRNSIHFLSTKLGFSPHVTGIGSTQPGDGSAVRNVVVDSPSWKEKVVGYAKKYRGTMLRRVRVRL